MPTATQTKNSKASDESDPVLLPVEFGGVSIGDETGRVALRINRDRMDLETADKMLCGRRLDCRIIVQPVSDDTNQTYSLDGVKFEVAGAADVTRVSFTPKHITAGLTFSLAEVSKGELCEFAKRSGRLEIHSVGEIPAKPKGRNKTGTPATDETNWRDHKIDELRGVTDHDMTLLKDAGVRTMGELEDHRKDMGNFQRIKGVGPAADGRILEGLLAWLDANRSAEGPLDEDDEEDDEEDE